MLLLEAAPDHATEADLQPMLDSLPPSWQARVLRKKPLKSRLQSAVGYTLLKRILQEHYHITELPAIVADDHGKPYFENCELHFSLSHCNAAVACIVEDHPVAVDVQDWLTDISPALAARIAAPLDPSAMTAQELTALWTQKEASAKLDGRGLKIGLENLPTKEHRVKTVTYPSFTVSIAI